VLTISGFASCAQPKDSTSERGFPGDKSLRFAGMTLEELRSLYRQELDNELDFWSRSGLDRDYGGFMCAMDHDGTLLDTEKNVTYQGRGLWVYSFLYNNFGKNPAHLETARKTKDFLFKYARQKDSTWPEVLSREGKVKIPFKGQIYDGLYVALGLQEYSQAAGDSEAWEVAADSLLKCMNLYDQAGYGTGLGSSGQYPPGSRLQGVEMVLVDLLTRMLARHPDSRLKSLQDSSLEVLISRFFNREFKLNNEILNHDYGCYTDKRWRNYVELGYSIASFWGLLYEAARRSDPGIFKTVGERLRRHLEVAWDDVYGGLGTSMDVESGCVDYRKVAYVHQEALIGTLSVIECLGESWARDWYSRIHRYAFEKFPIRRYPGWHSYMDRKCTPQRHVTRRENFHYPRFLMLSLLALDRLRRKDDRTKSGARLFRAHAEGQAWNSERSANV
jgi:N-acylglucosamine 2-epimerase